MGESPLDRVEFRRVRFGIGDGWAGGFFGNVFARLLIFDSTGSDSSRPRFDVDATGAGVRSLGIIGAELASGLAAIAGTTLSGASASDRFTCSLIDFRVVRFLTALSGNANDVDGCVGGGVAGLAGVT